MRKGNTQLNVEFHRTARTDKKAFLNEQCKETEENNRMGKTAWTVVLFVSRLKPKTIIKTVKINNNLCFIMLLSSLLPSQKLTKARFFFKVPHNLLLLLFGQPLPYIYKTSTGYHLTLIHRTPSV